MDVLKVGKNIYNFPHQEISLVTRKIEFTDERHNCKHKIFKLNTHETSSHINIDGIIFRCISDQNGFNA